jgi:hypothetical protein
MFAKLSGGIFFNFSVQPLLLAVQFISHNRTLGNCVYGLKMTLNKFSYFVGRTQDTGDFLEYSVQSLLFGVQKISDNETMNLSDSCVKITVVMSNHCLDGRKCHKCH